MESAALQDLHAIKTAAPTLQERIDAGIKVDEWMQKHAGHAKGEYMDGCEICVHKARLISLGTGKNAPRAKSFIEYQNIGRGPAYIDAILQTVNFSTWTEPSVHAPLLQVV